MITEIQKDLMILKIGTDCILTPNRRTIRRTVQKRIAQDVKNVYDLGKRVIIVSSGAIGFGEKSKYLKGLELTEQELSMVGQDQMVNSWRDVFNELGLEVAGAVYRNKDLIDQHRRWWTVKSLTEITAKGIIALINEQDSHTTTEIRAYKGFADNDELAYLTAVASKAGCLILLTKVAGVECPFTGKILSTIKSTERKIQSNIKTRKGDSFGGMHSKLKYAKKTVKEMTDTNVFIASFKEENILTRIVHGENVGTRIIP